MADSPASTHAPRAAIRNTLLSDFVPDESGPASIEQVLDRLVTARNACVRQMGRFLTLSVLFSGLYFIRVSELRADLTIFGQKVFEVPYGVFVFCVVSQALMCFALARFLDARVLDRLIRGVCDRQWPQQSWLIYQTFPNAWLDPSVNAINSLKENPRHRALLSLLMVVSSLSASVVIGGAVASGAYFLYDWKAQIQAGWVDLQYYVVVATSILTILWLIGVAVFFFVDDDPETDLLGTV